MGRPGQITVQVAVESGQPISVKIIGQAIINFQTSLFL